MSDTLRPASWLVENVDLIPPGGRVLDVASGRGRNALFLAARGFRVHAVDIQVQEVQRVQEVQGVQEVQHVPITTEALDLERGDVSLGHRCYDAVIVFNYLHRPLMPAIVDAVSDGGVLIYETFTVGQAERGRPKNPAFLLRAGELPTLVAPLRVLRSREVDFEGKLIASIVAAREPRSRA